MEFWLCLYGITSFLGLVNILIPNKYRILLLYNLVFVLWFIAAFRYMIGTDYNMYMTYFIQDVFLTVWDEGDVIAEPANICITLFVKAIGCGSQMYFLIYETIIMYFFYQGAKKLSDNVYTLFLIIILYTVIYMPGTYYWSMNAIRQAAAISICFWGSSFYFYGQINKAILVFIFAMTFHLSVPIMIIIFLLTVKLITRIKFTMLKIISLITLALMMTLTGISAKCLFFVLTNLPNYGDKYGDYVAMLSDEVSPTLGLLIVLTIIFITMSYHWLKNYKQSFFNKKIYSLVLIFMIIRILTSFQFVIQSIDVVAMIEAMLHRVDSYFVPFFILAIARWLNWELFTVKHNFMKATLITMIIISLFAMHSIRNIDIVANSITAFNNPSAGNIKYQMRFDLFNE